MSRVILLDSAPLGLLANPVQTSEVADCNRWLANGIAQGWRILVPEITDYEVRRELLRLSKTRSILRLDSLTSTLEYLPLTTSTMRQAASFWAQARQQGQPTAGDKTIDADMILAAQAATLNVQNTIIATSNVRHLSRFVNADLWQNIV
jgi:predicted nucleic acid-binding protein